jgi:hypothetical protein
MFNDSVQAEHEQQDHLRHERGQRRSRLIHEQRKLAREYEEELYKNIIAQSLSKQSKQEQRIVDQ